MGDREWVGGGVSNAADTYTWALNEPTTTTPTPAAVGGSAGGSVGRPSLRAPGPSLVVASDGVWGVLSNEDVTGLVARHRVKKLGATAVSEAIVAAAQKAGGRDNLSVVVVYLS